MTTETLQIAPPVTAEGQKLTEQERDQMEIRYLQVVNAQQAYDLAQHALQERDRMRREASARLITYRTQLEVKYKTSLAPGTGLLPDGTILPPPLSRQARPLTPADFAPPPVPGEMLPSRMATEPAPPSEPVG